jgi:N6-L-threonylcarbamoyladenine synthase
MPRIPQKIAILAIESSCDDTGASVLVDGNILSNVVSSQAVHTTYGGVVPELASRAHQSNIVPVVDLALQKAGMDKSQLSAVAFTQGPGLTGSLLVGASFAKALALGLEIPVIGINHLQAHLAAHFIDEPRPDFPFLCLLVSGGHTMIVKMDSVTDFQVLGRTIDDAAGEAFDKAAKVLGLPYPGGPILDKLARQGNPLRFHFTQPSVKGFDYSFSGMKTSFLYFIRDQLKGNENFIADNLADICASYQHALVSYLLSKFEKAARHSGISHVGIAGGVAANSSLREQLAAKALKNNWQVYIPAFEYCTDNAAMAAKAAWFKYLNNDFSSQSAEVFARGLD